MVDKDNFFFAYSHDNPADRSAPKQLALGYYQAGSKTIIADSITLPSSWTTLRIITKSSGLISVYADDSLLYSSTQSMNAIAAGAGLSISAWEWVSRIVGMTSRFSMRSEYPSITLFHRLIETEPKGIISVLQLTKLKL